MLTRVSTRNYVQIPKESECRWEWDFRVHTAKHRSQCSWLFLTTGFPRMPSTSISVGQPQKHFNANIMCSFTKKASASGGLRPPDPLPGSAPGPRWGTSVPQTSSLMSPPIILWDRRPWIDGWTSLAVIPHGHLKPATQPPPQQYRQVYIYISANSGGPHDASSRRIDHIALPTEYNYQAMNVCR